MTLSRVPITLLIALLALTGAAAPSGAQSPAAKTPPAQAPPVEVPDQPTPPAEAPGETRFSRPIFRLMQNYRLQQGEVVREIRSIISDVTIEGRVRGDVLVIVGSLQLAPTAVVEGSVVVIAGGVDVAPGAIVENDFVVVGGAVDAPPTFSPGREHVVIATPLFAGAFRDLRPWLTQGLLWGRLIVPDLGWVWTVVLMFFFVYLMLNTVVDRGVAATATVISDRPVGAFFAGLLVLLLAVPVLVIVAASVIGLVIVPFLICALIVATLIGKAAVARSIGRGLVRPALPEGRVAGFATFVIGFAVLTFAYVIPILGLVTWALTTVLGLGAATASVRAHMRREPKSPAPAPVASPPPIPPASQPVPAAPLAIEAPLAATAASPASAGATVFPAEATAPPIPPIPPIPPAAAPPMPPPLFVQGLAQYPRAPFMDRLAAFVLDCVLVAVINALLNRHSDDGFYFFLLMAYHIFFWAWKGTTLGGIVLNLRVIRTDGADPRPADAVIRGLSGILSIVALGIGYLWMLQDSEMQTWHDKIAGTLVVKVPRELVMR